MAQPEPTQPDLFGRTTPRQPPVPTPATVALPTRDSDLGTANAWFAVYLRGHRYSDNTIASYTDAVESLARSFPRAVPLRRLSPRRLQDYCRWLASQREHVPPTTVATRITGLRRFFRALAETGVLASNPASDLRLPQEPRRLPHVLGDDDEARLRQEARRQFEANAQTASLPLLLLLLMLDLGLRRSEIEALTPQSIVPQADGYQITVRHARQSQRYQNRTLTAPPEFAAVYRAYRTYHEPQGQSLIATPRRSLYRVVQRLGQSAGLGFPLTPATLRWTCARQWYETLPPAETQRRLGLSPIGWQHAEDVLIELVKRRAGEAHGARVAGGQTCQVRET